MMPACRERAAAGQDRPFYSALDCGANRRHVTDCSGSNGSARIWFMADCRDRKTAVKVTFYDEHADGSKRKTIGVLAFKPNCRHTQNKRKLSR